MKTWRSIRSTRLPIRLMASMMILLLFSTGCNSAEMTNYFAAADLEQEKPTLKFFRVTVKGQSSLSETRLQTGFYDAAALQSLFGVVSEKNSASAKKLVDPAKIVVEFDPASGTIKNIDQDQRFTVLFGSNADALASQISAFAQSQTTGEAISRLVGAAAGQEVHAGLISAKADAEQAKTNNTKVKGYLEETSKNYKAPAAGASTKAKEASRRLIVTQSIIASLIKSGVVFTQPNFTNTAPTTDTEADQLNKELDEADKVLNAVIEGIKNGGIS